jgi:polyferredoxin
LQLTVTALVAVIPFLRINGRAMLRIDLPALALEVGGHRFRIEEFFLVWLLALWLMFLFLLVALTLGRVWCGWGCPQTALSDLGEWLGKRIGPRPFRYLTFLLVSLWVGVTVVWYFIPPAEFISRLQQGQLGGWATGTLLAITLLTLINLTFVRRLFCREFCPYGRFQTVLTDRGTLTLQAHPNHLHRCLECQACLRACPTGIDIRQGFQIECISCARCLDACRVVMAKRGQEAIIRYTFGQADLGRTALFTTKTAALLLLVAGIGATALYQASHRATASFRIGRSPQLASRVTEAGHQVTFFSGSIANRRETVERFTLTVATDQGKPLTIKGRDHFELTGNEKRDLNLAVESALITGPNPVPITFTLLTAGDGARLSTTAYLTPAVSRDTAAKERP